MAGSDDNKIEIYNESLPQLESGGYHMRFEQNVSIKNKEEKFEEDLGIVVQGPKYRLPSKLIHDKSPSDSMIIHDFEVLPQITFTQKTLPWQRSTGLDTIVDKKPSWMVLLILHESEADYFSIKKSILFSDFLNETPNRPFGEDVLVPEIDSEEKDLLDRRDTCDMLVLDKDYFNRLVPCQDEIHLFSHVRKVNAERKALSKVLTERQEDEDIDISVVVSNRRPQRGNNKAILISIEDMGKHFPEGKDRKSNIEEKYTKIAFFQLTQWSFQLQTDPAGFQAMSKQLLDASDSYKIKGNQNNDSISQALNLGYIPMAHDLRNGDRTLSWYRGPLVPEPSSSAEIDIVEHSDQLERFNPENGMFDESYAAAWQIGRLIAMKDKAFTRSLMQWKETLNDKLRTETVQTHNRKALGLEDKNENDLDQTLSEELIEKLLKPKYDSIFKSLKSNENE